MSMALTAPPTRKRFLIVACLFIGIFIAYLDRVNVSVLAANEPFLAYMGIEGMPLQIGMMMTVFLAAYGIANVVLSPLGDYLGPRKAMMLCILIWTIALMIGGVATSFALIIICRILLGIGEGFYYPLQSVFIKNWFPKQERGRANAAWIVGQSVAPAIAMPFFTWWIGTHGWRSNFFLCAALGLIPLWLLWRYVADKPEQHKSISEQELAYIKAGQETESAGSSESFMLRVKPVITNYSYWLLVLWYLCLQCLYWRWGYRPFLENGSLSVIQPDICTCGGITEVKKICDMAHVYDKTVQIHVCGGPISTAVALHMETAIPNFVIHELHRYALLEPNTQTCKYNYLPKNGMYEVPELPGIGQELTEETMKKSPTITVK